jgi:enoyl-CoA hydratase
MPSVTCERSDHLAHLRLNRPNDGNRFTMEMFRLIGEAFTEVDADPDIRCTLLTANGEHFSIGVDVADVLPAWAAGRNPSAAGLSWRWLPTSVSPPTLPASRSRKFISASTPTAAVSSV